MWDKFVEFYYNRMLKYLIIGFLIFMFVGAAIADFRVFLVIVFIICVCWIAIPVGKYRVMDYQEYHYYFDDNFLGVLKRNFFKDISLAAAYISIICFIIYAKGIEYATELTNHGFTSWGIYNKIVNKFELLKVFSIFDLPKVALYLIKNGVYFILFIESDFKENESVTIYSGHNILFVALISLLIAIIFFVRGVHDNDEGIKGIVIDYLIFGHLNLLAIPFLCVGVVFGGFIVIPIVIFVLMMSGSSDSSSTSHTSVKSNGNSFGRVYYRYRDTSEQRYYLYSHGDDYAYLKDENGNEIFCYRYDKNGMLRDNDGNLYTPR